MTDKPTTIDTITADAKALLEVKRRELASAEKNKKDVQAAIKTYRADIARLERLCKAPTKRVRRAKPEAAGE